MKKTINIIIFTALILTGCKFDSEESFSNDRPERKIWVFAQINVPEEEGKIDTYWYYGKIPESLYQKISKNKKEKGFFQLTDIHYWGNDEALHPHEDEERTGEILFKIEDLRKVTRVKRPPRLPDQHEHILSKTEESDT